MFISTYRIASDVHVSKTAVMLFVVYVDDRNEVNTSHYSS